MAKAKFILTPDLVKVEPEPDAPEPIFTKSAFSKSEEESSKQVAQNSEVQTLPQQMASNVTHAETPQPQLAPVVPIAQQPEVISYIQNPQQAYPQPALAPASIEQERAGGQPYTQPAPMPNYPAPFMAAPQAAPAQTDEPAAKAIKREQFNLRIDSLLKREFHIWCLRNDISMTEALEEAIKKHIGMMDE